MRTVKRRKKTREKASVEEDVSGLDLGAVYEIIHEALEKLGVDTSDLDLVECLDLVASDWRNKHYLCLYKGYEIWLTVSRDGKRKKVLIRKQTKAVYP